jgi:hypothetical protein
MIWFAKTESPPSSKNSSSTPIGSMPSDDCQIATICRSVAVPAATY